MQYAGLGAGAVAVAILSGLALNHASAGAGAGEPSSTVSVAPTPSASVTDTPTSQPTRFAVVGDSNTEVDSADFSAGKVGPSSWVTTLMRSGDYVFAGGWADGGTTSTTQAEALQPASDVDVLLVMTGTNDLLQGVPFEQTTANLDEMVAKLPASRVVLLAIPPRDIEPVPTTSEFNSALEALASERGWEFFDGLSAVRAPEGGFVEGTTSDGTHLTADAQHQYGQVVLDYLAQ